MLTSRRDLVCRTNTNIYSASWQATTGSQHLDLRIGVEKDGSLEDRAKVPTSCYSCNFVSSYEEWHEVSPWDNSSSTLAEVHRMVFATVMMTETMTMVSYPSTIWPKGYKGKMLANPIFLLAYSISIPLYEKGQFLNTFTIAMLVIHRSQKTFIYSITCWIPVMAPRSVKCSIHVPGLP